MKEGGGGGHENKQVDINLYKDAEDDPIKERINEALKE